MLSGASGTMMGMAGGMSGSSGMGGMSTGGHNFWQARQMSAGGMPHMAYASGHGQQQHDAKMAEKIVTELQVSTFFSLVKSFGRMYFADKQVVLLNFHFFNAFFMK